MLHLSKFLLIILTAQIPPPIDRIPGAPPTDQWDWVVPVEDCAGCNYQMPNAPNYACCAFVPTGCTRQDNGPRVVHPGTPRVIGYGEVYCDNCCKWFPDECPGNSGQPEIRNCNFSAEWTVTTGSSVNVGIEGGVEAEARGITASLMAAMGAAGHREITYSERINCDLSSKKCRRSTSSATLVLLIGKRVAIDHKWRSQGIVLHRNSGPTSQCTPPCPMHGHSAQTGVCRESTSTAYGNSVDRKGCDGIKAGICGDRTPCNH